MSKMEINIAFQNLMYKIEHYQEESHIKYTPNINIKHNTITITSISENIFFIFNNNKYYLYYLHNYLELIKLKCLI